MKVVLDTNVLLSGFLWEGVCGQLLDRCFESPGMVVITSQYIVDDFVRQAADKLKAPAEKIERAMSYLQKHACMVTPDPVPPNACRDPDDLPVLGTAVAARADFLVTGDLDLLCLGAYEDIPIVSPAEFLRRLGASGPKSS